MDKVPVSPGRPAEPGRPRRIRRLAVLLGALVLVAAALVAAVVVRASASSGPKTTLRMIGLNDFHGTLQPVNGAAGKVTQDDGTTVDAGGAAYLATHLTRLRTEASNAVLLSTGDIGGTSQLASALFHDEPTVEFLNGLGVAASVAGNHEFDEGLPELLRLQHGGCHPADGCRFRPSFGGAGFPFLAANVTTDDGERPLPAYTVLDIDGVKVGVIGVTLDEMASVVSPEMLRGLRFSDDAEAVNRASDELAAIGVTVQVALVHDGDVSTGGPDQCAVKPNGPVMRLARTVSPQVDVIFTAHTHEQYVCTVPDPAGVPRPIVQGLSHGRLLSVVDLTVENGDVVRDRTRARNEVITRDVPPDPAVDTLVARAVQVAAPIAAERVGSVAADLLRAPASSGESGLGDVVADAQLAATRFDGAQIALVNLAGLRADLRFAPDGRITYGEVFAMLPFGRTVKTLTMTGEQLRQVLEQQWQRDTAQVLQVSSTLRYSWSQAAPVGSKVSDLRINGRPVEPAATYRVAVDDFLAGGGNDFSAFSAASAASPGPLDLDALLSYVRETPRLSPPTTKRITMLP